MDDYITQVEGRLLRMKVKEQEDEIANLKNHIKELQRIIEKGGVCDGREANVHTENH